MVKIDMGSVKKNHTAAERIAEKIIYL